MLNFVYTVHQGLRLQILAHDILLVGHSLRRQYSTGSAIHRGIRRTQSHDRKDKVISTYLREKAIKRDFKKVHRHGDDGIRTAADARKSPPELRPFQFSGLRGSRSTYKSDLGRSSTQHQSRQEAFRNQLRALDSRATDPIRRENGPAEDPGFHSPRFQPDRPSWQTRALRRTQKLAISGSRKNNLGGSFHRTSNSKYESSNLQRYQSNDLSSTRRPLQVREDEQNDDQRYESSNLQRYQSNDLSSTRRPLQVREDEQNNDQRDRPKEVSISSGYSKTALGDLKTVAPHSIPYTTAASEFLYGTSAVVAALKSEGRKIYKLYIYEGENREKGQRDDWIRKMALARRITVMTVAGNWMPLLDKMSGGRPHNGYILEASPLPKLPVVDLQPIPFPENTITVSLNHQSVEEENINGADTSIEYNASFRRYPFVVLLDGVLDPGNLGAIVRTAFYLGVDALAIATDNSAPLSPVALKAAAGAAENLPILSVSNVPTFIELSQRNGWKFYAGTTPDVVSQNSSASPSTSKRQKGQPHLTTSNLFFPVVKHPCVLIFGGEGEGIRPNVLKKVDSLVSVEGYRAGQHGVDSLNVSIAAALLCEAFLRKAPNSMLRAKVKEDKAAQKRLKAARKRLIRQGVFDDVSKPGASGAGASGAEVSDSNNNDNGAASLEEEDEEEDDDEEEEEEEDDDDDKDYKDTFDDVDGSFDDPDDVDDTDLPDDQPPTRTQRRGRNKIF